MAVLKRDSDILATQVWIADTPWSRVRGLLGRSSLPSTEAMWIKPCNSIHTFFMKFSIDAVFTDRSLVVKKVHRDIQPGKLLWPVWTAHSVFEFSAGFLIEHPIRVGDQLHVDP